MAIGSSGFGVVNVSGRSRVPSPPTRTTAFTARAHGVVVVVAAGVVVVAPGAVVVVVAASIARHGDFLLRIAVCWSEIWSNDVHACVGNGISAPFGNDVDRHRSTVCWW